MSDNSDAARGPETGDITGAYAGQGVECPQFRLDTGETVSLVHMPADIKNGETVTLRGRWQLASKCMQGRTFRVVSRKTD